MYYACCVGGSKFYIFISLLSVLVYVCVNVV